VLVQQLTGHLFSPLAFPHSYFLVRSGTRAAAVRLATLLFPALFSQKLFNLARRNRVHTPQLLKVRSSVVSVFAKKKAFRLFVRFFVLFTFFFFVCLVRVCTTDALLVTLASG
jgi:hypothetical protein